MPNRIIKESICVSESIDSLSWFDEVFFYRLIVNCDDYGRLDARPAILKARLFPLKDITAGIITDALRDLEAAGMVLLYQSRDKPFLQLVSWEAHQSIRAKRSKYPAPGIVPAEAGDGCSGFHKQFGSGFAGTQAGECMEKTEAIHNSIDCQGNNSAGICGQMHADADGCARNPIQTNLKQNPNLYLNPNPSDGEGLFDEFWAAYPKKAGKKDARRVWEKLCPNRDLAKEITKGLLQWRQSAQWCKDGGRYIPYPATFLNGERWKDECTQETGYTLRGSKGESGGKTVWSGDNLNGNYDYQEIARIAAEKLKRRDGSEGRQKEEY